MGILSGKDLFNSKYITAVITDGANRAFFVPIKKTIGDYFLAEIEDQFYCFKIDGGRVKVYQHTLVKSFRFIIYDINHYLPVSASDNKELENVLRKNALPKMNMMLYNILKLLGKREKQEFKPHNLNELINEVAEHEKEYKERVTNIKNYLSHLNITEIVTPVRKLSEFIELDLLTTDSKFMGAIVTQHARADQEHKKVTNTPEKGKIAWIKIILILLVVTVIGGAVYWGIETGVFENLLPSLPTFGATSNPVGILDQYPTPEALKAAIDRGEVDYNKLDPDVKAMVDQVETPTVEPKG